MTRKSVGRLPLSENRSLVLDVLHFGRRVPQFPAEKDFDLREVAEARSQCSARISWAAIFLKGYGLVAAEVPELRQAYIDLPWPHLYQFPQNVAILSVAREYLGEDRLFWGYLTEPEAMPLAELQRAIDRYKNDPPETTYAAQIAAARRPLLLRRLMMWFGLNFLGRARGPTYGTFALSTLAGQGVYNRGHPSLLTTSLTYGPLSDEGKTLVTLLCDHRVLDGAMAARVLNQLERTLQTTISEELRAMSGSSSSVALPRTQATAAT